MRNPYATVLEINGDNTTMGTDAEQQLINIEFAQ